MQYLIMLLGAAIIVLLLSTLSEESRARKKRASRLLHTDFVSVKKGLIQPVSLRTTQVTIGRLPGNDICLAGIDPQKRISRVHCILWWADTHFRIAPKYTTRLVRFRLKTSRPEVLVKGIPAPVGTGLPVACGDHISICGHLFKLVDTAPGDEPESFFGGLLLREKPRRATKKLPAGNRTLRRLLLALIALALAVCVAVGAWSMWIDPPADGDSDIGTRREDTASILVCGTDRDGDRTDTIMLCQISGEDRSVRLLSIPRDLRTTNSRGKVVRINAVYGNRGAEGMEELMDNVAMFLGYRPDGYVVFDWQLVRELVDNMGGVTVTLDHHIRVDDVYFPEGEQELDGEMVLAALRYRAGYANADIGRVEVQRTIVRACIEQWVSLRKLPKLLDQAEHVLENAVTDLSMSNMVWLGSTCLGCGSGLEITDDVIPTTPVYADGSYKGERANQEALLKLLNESFNPFHGQITAEHLSITN